MKTLLFFASAIVCAVSALAVSPTANAMPAFARRYETSCSTCHQFHYPRLNSYGRRFRENGYQLPAGAEDAVRAKRSVEPGTLAEVLSIFKETPISVRAQVFGIVNLDPGAQDKQVYENRLFSFIIGGGSVAEDVSFFFSWTPFPDPAIHQARIGFHNIAETKLGTGTLNVRAGALFLLDFQRPGHRFLAPGPNSAGSVPVGLNGFHLDDPTLGVEAYGRPRWGPFAYELALVTGDPGDGNLEQDDWKDVFARSSYILFHNTDHEASLGLFGYLGRSDIVLNLGGIDIALRDDFWIVGGDVELDVGAFNIAAMAYASTHSNPAPGVNNVAFQATRLELTWGFARKWTGSVRYEQVFSTDDTSLERAQVAPHLTYAAASNVLITTAWRQDLRQPEQSSWVLVAEAAF